jgi:hypothetical protein
MKDEADSAFQTLMDELQLFHDQLAQEAQAAAQAMRYGEARAAIAKAEGVSALIGSAADLHERWRQLLTAPPIPPPPPKKRPPPKKPGEKGPRKPRGLLTPHAAFFRPILQALVELGGAAPKRTVVDRVGTLIRDRLNPHDWEPLRSGEPRWRNRAAWTRICLIKEKFLSPNSDHGTWEITDAGRRWLSEGSPVPRSVPGWKTDQAKRASATVGQ